MDVLFCLMFFILLGLNILFKLGLLRDYKIVGSLHYTSLLM